MNTKMIRIYLFSFAPLLMLAGCERLERAEPMIVHCPPDCELVINLPDNVTLPPEVSEEYFHVAGGVDVEITLQGGPAGMETTVLRFTPPNLAFVNRGGQPMATVPLGKGKNTFRIRPYDDGFCHEPDGCKYTIVNTGNPERSERDPYFIIHPH